MPYIIKVKDKDMFLKKGANRYSQISFHEDIAHARTWPSKVGPAQTLSALRNYRNGKQFMKDYGVGIDELEIVPVKITIIKESK